MRNLMRMALKLATGAGKTTVMAMLIAWQTINAVRKLNGRTSVRNGTSSIEFLKGYPG